MTRPTTSNVHRSTKNAPRRLLTAGLLVCLTAFSALASFERGNDAFRARNYTAAVAEYHRAIDDGDASSMLHFNLGVAYFKLGRYGSAESAFVNAASDPLLAPRAYYNLGLIARRRGDDENARGWFDQASAQPSASDKIRRLSRAATRTLKPPVRLKLYVREDERGRWREHFLLSLNTGFASDSNVYRSPADPYVDLSDPTAPTITPEVQSSTYMPVNLDAEVRWGTHHDAHFRIRYTFDGDIYSGDYANATQMVHEVSFGGELDRETKRGGIFSTAEFFVARYEEQSYDRDDGQEQFVGTESVTDRFSYTEAGPRVYYHRDLGPIGFGMMLEGSISNYDETVDFLDLTNETYRAGAHVSYKPFERTFLRLRYDKAQRHYGERVARDLNGLLLAGNENLVYDYTTYGFTARQRLTNWLWTGIDYRYTMRKDMFVGYDDYERHSGRVQLRLHTGRFKARAAVTHRLYDFPNAFAFNNPVAGDKELTTSYASLDARVRLTRSFSVTVEGVLNLVESTDPRVEYDRTRASIGLRYRI